MNPPVVPRSCHLSWRGNIQPSSMVTPCINAMPAPAPLRKDRPADSNGFRVLVVASQNNRGRRLWDDIAACLRSRPNVDISVRELPTQAEIESASLCIRARPNRKSPRRVASPQHTRKQDARPDDPGHEADGEDISYHAQDGRPNQCRTRLGSAQ